jgi:hypothetical protein
VTGKRTANKELLGRSRLFVAIAIAALLVAGCGSKKTNAPPVELEDQLGFSESGIAERQSRVEGAIRDCMKAQGFDYVPVDPLAQRAALTGNARLSDEEFQKQFGYGISTLFGRGTEQSDPNDRVRKSLSAADRAAYDRALFGESPGLTFQEAIDNDRATDLGGCTKQATEAIFGGAAVLATVQNKFDDLEERITQDQRMVRAVEKWSACMAENGYQYNEPEDIDTDLAKRFESIVGVGVEPGATVPPDQGTSYDRAALAQLQHEEVKIANADLQCERSQITHVERVVRPQYESTFRKENRSLLARVRPVGQ